MSRIGNEWTNSVVIDVKGMKIDRLETAIFGPSKNTIFG